MEKRKMVFGSYDTAAKGWTLTGWLLDPPQQKTNYIDKIGGDGSWDMSTAMTGGIPRYYDRNLSATFETSDGNRANREALIREMVNTLDGYKLDIELPDLPSFHLVGRVHVARNYSDLAHASVTVTAVCEPWLYANAETVVTLTASTAGTSARIVNNGRRAIVPALTVPEGANLRMEYAGASLSLVGGTYRWPDLLLTPGAHDVKCIGSGSVRITYREAVLE